MHACTNTLYKCMYRVPGKAFRPLFTLLGGVGNVASFITVNEQSESIPDCMCVTLIFLNMLPGDHITRIYLHHHTSKSFTQYTQYTVYTVCKCDATNKTS